MTVAIPVVVAELCFVLISHEPDVLHPPDRHPSILQRSPDAEALHRFIEIGFHQDFLFKQSPGAEDNDRQHNEGDAAEHEQSDLKVVGLCAHGTDTSRLKNCRTPGSVE